MSGPTVRTNIVEVYVFCRHAKDGGEGEGGRGDELSFLQLRRSRPPMAGSWQPVMGHIEAGETAVEAGLRELMEETNLSPMSDDVGRCVWQLEAVNTFFLASLDTIFMCPGLAVEVQPDSPVTIDDAHDDFRWIKQDQTEARFLWPGQRTAARQIVNEIALADGRLRPYLRL